MPQPGPDGACYGNACFIISTRTFIETPSGGRSAETGHGPSLRRARNAQGGSTGVDCRGRLREFDGKGLTAITP